MRGTHSLVNKSIIILICILLSGAVAEAAAFYYVQNFVPSFPSSVTASFQVTNLSIDPYEARINQPVNISADVTNLGDIQSGYSLILKINDLMVETKNLEFAANESKLVTFSVSEAKEGSYNVTVADLVGAFTVTSAPTPMPAALKVSNMFVNPVEVWPGQAINVSVDVTNTGSENVSYTLPFLVNDAVVQRVQVQLAGGAAESILTSFNESIIGSYRAVVGGKTTSFKVVETGKHTLNVISSRGGFSFTLDGTPEVAPYKELVDVGPHTIAFPAEEQIQVSGWGTVKFDFASWNDGSTQLSKTVDIEAQTYAVTYYIRLGSCPSLYTWNGTSYSYAAEVSDGAGWLGYLDHFQPDGSMVFSYNYPWDYIKLNPSQLQPQNGFYSMKIAETSDEIFYLDSAKLVAIDHPANTDLFSTTSTFIYNLAGQGTMYTVSKNPALPVSAVDGKGQNVLPLISKLDGNTTSSTIWTWNQLTLNLGNLTGAQQIKLVVGATINWPTTQAGGNNFMKYANQPGVTPSPPPYMEVKAANGSWIRVPDDRQFPLPDVTDQMFVVNLTGLFPTNDYELRINTYQDIRFDYIGVDTTPQQNLNIQTIMPTYANLQQGYTSESNSSGAFTRYGDVLSLLQSADDKFVVGREGDVVSLQFPVDTTPVPKDMVRDYYVIASCWFKGKGLSYVLFSVDPLPFQAMTSFPYPANQSYPYDAAHKAYLQAYNTRIINSP
jgi:hypothetical protein